jgi:uncharacterized protein (TIRG00374 family)
MKKRWQQIFGWILGICLLFVYIFYFFDWNKTKQVLAAAQITTIGLAVICFIASYFLKALKWTYILKCQENISWRNGYHTMMVSGLVNYTFPARVGEILRLVLVKKTSDISYSSSTAASLIDNFSLMLFVLIFLLFIPFTDFNLPQWASGFITSFYVFLIISVIIFIMVFVLGIHFSNFFKKWLQRVLASFNIEQAKIDNLLNGRIFNFLEKTIQQCHFSAYTKSSLLMVIFMAFMIVCSDGFSFYFLISAFGLSVTYLQAILATCFFYVVFLLPSPPGRVGTAEMYLILVFSGLFHLPSSIISTAAILWHILVTAIAAILGIFSSISLGLGLKKLLNFCSNAPQDIHD